MESHDVGTGTGMEERTRGGYGRDQGHKKKKIRIGRAVDSGAGGYVSKKGKV